MTIQLEQVEDLSQIVESEEVAGAEHGEINVLLAWHLAAHVYPRKLGRVFDGQTNFEIGGLPPKRHPDLAFVRLERMPERIKSEVPFAPDLAVEIISPTDSLDEIDAKRIQYQRSGVKLIWIIRTVSKIVEVYHPTDLKPVSLSIEDELDGEEVVVGFRLPVKALFEQ